MTRRSIALIMTCAAVALIAVTPASRRAPLLLWNGSESVPIGLYRVRPIGIRSVSTLVVVMPPEPLAAFLEQGGYLPRGTALLKRIAALPGQSVCRDGLLVSIDGNFVGAAHERDRRGRLLPRWEGCRMIAKDEVFLMNPDEPASLDGRYFGAIPSSAIVGQAEPVWTFEQQRRRDSGASSERELVRPTTASSPLSRPTLRALQAPRFPSDGLAPSIEPPRELNAPQIVFAARAAPA